MSMTVSGEEYNPLLGGVSLFLGMIVSGKKATNYGQSYGGSRRTALSAPPIQAAHKGILRTISES